jgi:hypothetical protein
VLFFALESQHEAIDKDARGTRGYIQTKEKQFKLSKDKTFKESQIDYMLLELHFSCKGPDICSVENFLM